MSGAEVTEAGSQELLPKWSQMGSWAAGTQTGADMGSWCMEGKNLGTNPSCWACKSHSLRLSWPPKLFLKYQHFLLYKCENEKHGCKLQQSRMLLTDFKSKARCSSATIFVLHVKINRLTHLCHILLAHITSFIIRALSPLKYS